MSNVKNIKKYMKIFTNLEEDKNNNFFKYLEDNNISLINFLLELGLNQELVQTFTYEEINRLALTVLNGDGFPTISFSLGTEAKENDTVSLYYNTPKTLIIYPEKITFSDCFEEEKESQINRCFKMKKYLLVNNIIRNNHFEITESHSKEKKTYVEYLKLKARELDYAKSGEVIKDRSIEIDVNCRLGSNLYSIIFGSINYNSINSIVGKINDLIKEGKLAREDVKFSQGDGGLKF